MHTKRLCVWRMETKETPEQCGYECEFIESPPEAFKTACPICLNILRDPYEVNCCGKNFCHACFKKVQATGKSCPACNKEFSAHPNLGLRQSLIQLPVRCSHHKDGCEWIGELGELDKHLNLNPEPDKRLGGCKYAQIPCVHCANLFERHLIPNHESECPQQPVKCDFHFAGCNVRLQCGDMPAHLAECAAEHLSLVAKRLEGDGRKIAELETKLAKAVQEKNELENANICLEKKVDNLKNETKVSIQNVDRQVDARTREINELKGKVDQRGQQVDEQEQDIDELKRQQEQKGQHIGWWIIVAVVVAIAALVVSSGVNHSVLRQEIAALVVSSGVNHSVLHQEIAALVVSSGVNHSVLRQEIAALVVSSGVNHSVLHQEISQHVTKLVTKHKEMETSFNSQLREVTSKQEQISKLVHTPVVPVVITMDIFAHHKNEDKQWFSDPFYTHPHGYKMCLNVYANGNGLGKGTHVSVYVHLMRGEFDDHLQWPFRGDIPVQLLNQLEDKDHHSMTISFTDDSDTDAGRVTTGERSGVGWGKSTFISHEELDKANGAKYLEKDCLKFHIKVVL